MSVDFARAVVAGLEHNGIRVRYPLGDRWLRNGNGQTSDYRGLIWHHTATALSNTAPSVLWRGRPDLPGPLCNTAGLADGSVAMIAAHPANHAGASGGRSMGPLPTTRTFNRYVWGHEIVYPGNSPMTPAQYRTMQILGAVISGILRRPSAEWCRGHAETSITGKWDPGYAPDRTIDLGAARRDTWAALFSPAPTIAPASRKDDTMTPIDLRFYDHDGIDPGPQTPDGLYFRGSLPAELGANSTVISAAWVRWVAYWGTCTWRIVAWDAVKPIAEADPRFDWWALPPGARGLTVEGRREHPGVQPAASLLVLAK